MDGIHPKKICITNVFLSDSSRRRVFLCCVKLKVSRFGCDYAKRTWRQTRDQSCDCGAHLSAQVDVLSDNSVTEYVFVTEHRKSAFFGEQNCEY